MNNIIKTHEITCITIWHNMNKIEIFHIRPIMHLNEHICKCVEGNALHVNMYVCKHNLCLFRQKTDTECKQVKHKINRNQIC